MTLTKLKDPKVTEAFQVMIGGKFAPLITLDSQDTDLESLTATLNTAETVTASEIIGKYRQTKKPWVTKDVLELCDKRRELKREKRSRRS